MSRRARARRIAAIACSAFIGVMEFVAWGMMLGNTGSKLLAVYGLENLKFFTVLSNLLLGVVSLVYAAFLIAAMVRGRRAEGAAGAENAAVACWRVPLGLQVAKLVAVTATTLTFLTVMLFLAPLFGYGALLQNANLYFHLVLPVLGIVEFVFLDEGPRLRLSHAALAVVPSVLYGTFYLVNVLVNGVGEWPNPNDWYGFAHWGIPVGIGIFAAITLATWLIAIVLRAANNALASRTRS